MIEFNDKTNIERLFSISSYSWKDVVNPAPDSARAEALKRQKAFIQTYNNRLINNKTVCE